MSTDTRGKYRMTVTRRRLLAASLAAPAILRGRRAGAETITIRMGVLNA